METSSTVDDDARTVGLHPDARDGVAHTVVDIRSGGVSRRWPWGTPPQR